MKTIISNGKEFKIRCVYVEKSSIHKNVAYKVQLEIFNEDGKQLDIQEISEELNFVISKKLTENFGF